MPAPDLKGKQTPEDAALHALEVGRGGVDGPRTSIALGNGEPLVFDVDRVKVGFVETESPCEFGRVVPAPFGEKIEEAHTVHPAS